MDCFKNRLEVSGLGTVNLLIIITIVFVFMFIILNTFYIICKKTSRSEKYSSEFQCLARFNIWFVVVFSPSIVENPDEDVMQMVQMREKEPTNDLS